MSHVPSEPSMALTSVQHGDAGVARVDDAAQLDEETVHEILAESETRSVLSGLGMGAAMVIAVSIAPVAGAASGAILAAASMLAFGVDALRLRATSKATGIDARLLWRVELAFHREAMRLSFEDVRAGRFRALFFRRSAETRALAAPRVLARVQRTR